MRMKLDQSFGAGALRIPILTALTGPVQFLTMRLTRYGVLLRTSRLIPQCNIICLDNG